MLSHVVHGLSFFLFVVPLPPLAHINGLNLLLWITSRNRVSVQKEKCFSEYFYVSYCWKHKIEWNYFASAIDVFHSFSSKHASCWMAFKIYFSILMLWLSWSVFLYRRWFEEVVFSHNYSCEPPDLRGKLAKLERIDARSEKIFPETQFAKNFERSANILSSVEEKRRFHLRTGRNGDESVPAWNVLSAWLELMLIYTSANYRWE